MTKEQLLEILSKDPNTQVKEFSISSYSLPAWSDLVKDYDPMQHKIFDVTIYPPKLNELGIDDFKRTPLALQKLAVNRIAQSMFSSPVQRQYAYDRKQTAQDEAVKLLEELYRTRNSIDATNIERSKKLNASCQVVTIWNTIEKPMQVGLNQSKFTLKHTVYSEMDGYKLWPIIDDNGDLLVFSIAYKDKSNKDYFITYINAIDTAKPKVILYVKESNWIVVDQYPKELEIFPVLYMNTTEPVWGGQAGTSLVEQLEEMESYQGLYIKRNTLPTFTLDYGDLQPGDVQDTTTTETSNDSRRIIKVGKGGSMKDVTWQGATEAIEARYQRLRNAFFEQIQIPDTSFANMIKSNTSAENKELIFSDARAKAEDLGGEWEKMFFMEMEVVKAFAKIMFPSYSAVLDLISVRSIIKPYNVRTKKENAEYVATAGDAMSMETKVRILDEVDDVEQEVEIIEAGASAQANQLQ